MLICFEEGANGIATGGQYKCYYYGRSKHVLLLRAANARAIATNTLKRE